MSIPVPRTCTEILPENPDPRREPACGLLDTFRSAPAYVLLGDPGSGKSTAFCVEAKALGEDAVLVSARDFLTFAVDNHAEWQGKILFIDGLDEIRVGSSDRRKALDEIRHHLYALGRPRFRISCREADWLGNNDRTALTSVSTDQKVKTLRLNPLTDDDVAQILDVHHNVEDARGFMAEARERGIDGLLSNPLTLDLLARAVGAAGAWPRSKLETFKMACLQMAAEENEEHIHGDRPPPPDQLLDPAGRLCAHQLISDAAGFALWYEEGAVDYIAPDTQVGLGLEMARHVLETRLFTGIGNGRFTPVHRHIAEFLGARHLANLIQQGLPLGRVLSLIAGGDGTVVSAFRGLHAWLAVHCYDVDVRDQLIEGDPVGVGLYGDLDGFSTEQRRRLLLSLDREVADYGVNVSAFKALAAPDMICVVRDCLGNTRRDDDHQTVTGFLLLVLQQAEPLTSLAPLLIDVVYDASRWPSVSKSALDAFTHVQVDSDDKTRELKRLLDGIRNDRVSDPDGELLGMLLTHLYPQEVPPSELWEYLPLGGRPDFIGAYFSFWEWRIHEQSSDAEVAELLDCLYERLPALRSAFAMNYYVDSLPSRLLAFALQTRGDQQASPRLYNWLKAGAFSAHGQVGSDDEINQQVITWLEQRPEVQKAVLLEGLIRYPDDDEFELHAREVWDCLHGSTLPEDFGPWCLDAAVEQVDTNRRVAQYLLRLAADLGLSRAALMERARGHEALERYIQDIFESRTQALTVTRLGRIEASREETDRRREQWIDHIRANVDALRENQADPALLFRLGRAYFDRYRKAGMGRLVQGELAEVLEHHELGEVALDGLRQTVWRQDVPEIDEIVQLSSESHISPLGPPFLAGMDIMDREDPEQLERLSRHRMRLALAFYYSTPTDGGPDPAWYLRWLDSRPELVADVLVQCATAAIHNGKDYFAGMYELAHRQNHAEVARHASMALLSTFPLCCDSQQLKTLDHLLWSAIQHADRDSLQALIEERLSLDIIHLAQRVHWLAVGVVIAPETHLRSLETWVSGDDDLAREAAAFFCPGMRRSFLIDHLDAPTLQTLIALMGRTFAPLELDGIFTPAMEVSDQIQGLIRRLSAVQNADASRSFNHLLADEALSNWRFHLEQARERQLIALREASYQYPDIERVRQTLSNEAPASATDLAALLVDRLEELARRIRTGNTDDWRQYWNEPVRGRPESPKIEDHCRDALLSDLKNLLKPIGVDAQREGQYANDRRSDIRVSYGTFNVPVEIKRDRHRELWSALRDQLMAKYTIDPATGGYGIYLVFWFGDGKVQSSPSGPRPSNPQELREWLEASLTEDERRRITVLVVDVSSVGS